MPGKQPRHSEDKLTKKQSVIAGQLLRKEFDPSENTQMDMAKRTALLAKINELFVDQGFAPLYSLRKLEDWRANCVYRWKCREWKKKPECWGTDGRKRCRKARRSKMTIAADGATQQTLQVATPSAPGLGSMFAQPVDSATGTFIDPENGGVVAEALPAHSATKRPLENVTNMLMSNPDWLGFQGMPKLSSPVQPLGAPPQLTSCPAKAWVTATPAPAMSVIPAEEAGSVQIDDAQPSTSLPPATSAATTAKMPASLASVLASSSPAAPSSISMTVSLGETNSVPSSPVDDPGQAGLPVDQCGLRIKLAIEPTPNQPRLSFGSFDDLVCGRPFGSRPSGLWRDSGIINLGLDVCSPFFHVQAAKRQRVSDDGAAGLPPALDASSANLAAAMLLNPI